MILYVFSPSSSGMSAAPSSGREHINRYQHDDAQMQEEGDFESDEWEVVEEDQGNCLQNIQIVDDYIQSAGASSVSQSQRHSVQDLGTCSIWYVCMKIADCHVLFVCPNIYYATFLFFCPVCFFLMSHQQHSIQPIISALSLFDL
jgi:hypothetical protein